jgi:CheY-like chemotaxis protein
MQAPHPVRVFVAEDDYLIADDISQALEQAGATVVGPVPTLSQSLMRLTDVRGIEVAVLDINLRGNLVFPAADLLQKASVPIVFFSAYDEIILPERFSKETRISKVRGISEVVAAVLNTWSGRVGGLPCQEAEEPTLVLDLLPPLRIRARQLTGEREKADDLVERALESAIALAERGDLATKPLSVKLHELLLQAYEQARKH